MCFHISLPSLKHVFRRQQHWSAAGAIICKPGLRLIGCSWYDAIHWVGNIYFNKKRTRCLVFSTRSRIGWLASFLLPEPNVFLSRRRSSHEKTEGFGDIGFSSPRFWDFRSSYLQTGLVSWRSWRQDLRNSICKMIPYV